MFCIFYLIWHLENPCKLAVTFPTLQTRKPSFKEDKLTLFVKVTQMINSWVENSDPWPVWFQSVIAFIALQHNYYFLKVRKWSTEVLGLQRTVWLSLPLYMALRDQEMSPEPCQYTLARKTAKKCLVFSWKYSCNLEMILLWIFWEINQSPVKTHSVHFYPNCIFGLVFLSLRISYCIPGLFKNMSLLGHRELLSTQYHAGTSWVPQEWSPAEEGLPFSISCGRVTSRSCRAVSASILLARGFWEACLPIFGGIKGRINKNGSFLITSGR